MPGPDATSRLGQPPGPRAVRVLSVVALLAVGAFASSASGVVAAAPPPGQAASQDDHAGHVDHVDHVGYVDRAGPAAAKVLAPYVPSPGSWRLGVKIERVVHAFDLPGTDDELLLCAGSGNSVAWADARKFVCYRYDRDTGQYSTFQTPVDWFCNAAVHLHNGDLLVASGTGIDGYPTRNGGTWAGTPESYTYSPETGAITRIGNVIPAWYPGLLEDHLGGVYKHGGSHSGGGITAWEYLPKGQTQWTRLPWTYPTRFYSDIRLIAPGLGAYTGATSSPSSTRSPALVNLTTGKRTNTPGLRQQASRKSAASVLLYPAQERKVLVIGGATSSGAGIREVDLIDYAVWPQRVPSFVPRAPLPQGLALVLATLLPNGQLFATGGATQWRRTNALWAAIYDPVGDRWIPVARPTIGRNYHSTIMTSLDGRVSTFGSNPFSGFEDDEEIYSPWYLSQPRPVIESIPEHLTYGGQYQLDVTLPAGTTLGYLTLERARADTHVYVPNQTMADLPFTVGAGGQVTVQVPTDRALLPPGYYKLAANTTGQVPSRQVWVHID
jgi:hypothetical protein